MRWQHLLREIEDRRLRLAALDHRVDQLDDVGRVRVAIEIEGELARGPHDVGGLDEAQITLPPRAESESDVREGLERGDESALRAQRPLGDPRDLSEVARQKTDDLVALAVSAGAQDDGRRLNGKPWFGWIFSRYRTGKRIYRD